MKIASNEEMKSIDRRAIEEFGIPAIILMENAAYGVVEEICKDFAPGSYITIVSGKGNNGGDGFAVARQLHNKGYGVKVFYTGDRGEFTEDALTNYDILKAIGVEVEEISDHSNTKELQYSIIKSDLVVDALFGTGLNDEIFGIANEVIRIINEYKNYVVSVDIPSGVIGNDGNIAGNAVMADKTIVISTPKYGNILHPGTVYNGEIIFKNIGIPEVAKMDENIKANLITASLVKNLIPRRNSNSHKGVYGKMCLVAGSYGMTGAAILTAKAALRSGLGLLKLIIPESLNHIITSSVPEAITVPLSEMRKGIIGINHISSIISESETASVITIGPGCGNTAELSEVIRRVLEEVDIPIVIDADGLNALSKDVKWLESRKSENVVLTPHIGEMSRLTGLEIEEIKSNKISVAREYAEKWNVILVLKDSRTIVAKPNGEIFINYNGNSGMATAGSGDVLTGIISSFIAQGLSIEEAAIAGVYVHGDAGDKAAKDKGEHGLLSGDIVDGLTYTLKDIVGTI